MVYYGEDNRIDGAILNVLRRKAESIRKSLGVSVPLLIDSTKIMEAIFEALFLHGRASPQQLAFDFDDAELCLKVMEVEWQNATERGEGQSYPLRASLVAVGRSGARVARGGRRPG